MSLDSFSTRKSLTVGGETVDYFSLPALAAAGFPGIATLPFSLKVLLENLLRREDGATVTANDVKKVASWRPGAASDAEISFMPARVLLQDFTGVPCIADLAAMRDGIVALGGNPDKVNPLQPVELVIDHSVQVDHFARPDALKLNADLEYLRNRERYVFLRWGQTAFRNFRVVPPETGIVHQVNIEYLARVICREAKDGHTLAYPDSVFGTDSHTTMVNGLGVVGWGVGGIEAEAAMLGQPSSMLVPEVVGCRLTGQLPAGTTATDLVLTITEALRKKGVVAKFVEFFGPGLKHLTIADRVTLGNMCPEYGATVAIFPIDDMTLEYLRFTGRDELRQLVLILDARIAHANFYEKAVLLGLGKWIRSLMLDRVLGCEDNEDRRQRATCAINCHLSLLHGFEQGRLGFSGGTVDFVCQQKIRENRPAHHPEFLRLQVENARARDIGGHQVRCELNALKFAGDRPRQRLHQQRLPNAGNAFDERVSASEQGYECEIDGLVLADDDSAQPFSNPARAAGDHGERCRRWRFCGRRGCLRVRA